MKGRVIIPFSLQGAMEGKKIVRKSYLNDLYKFGQVSPDNKSFTLWYKDGLNDLSWQVLEFGRDQTLDYLFLEDPLPEEPTLTDEEIRRSVPKYHPSAQSVWLEGAKWARDQIQNKK